MHVPQVCYLPNRLLSLVGTIVPKVPSLLQSHIVFALRLGVLNSDAVAIDHPVRGSQTKREALSDTVSHRSIFSTILSCRHSPKLMRLTYRRPAQGGAFLLDNLLSIPSTPTPTTSPGAEIPTASRIHQMMADPASTDTATEKLCANCSSTRPLPLLIRRADEPVAVRTGW
jgi:hypothetical protein